MKKMLYTSMIKAVTTLLLITLWLTSSFYLSDKGIHFYFSPYDLACYGAGFQEVVIPYEEFEMKIFQ